MKPAGLSTLMDVALPESREQQLLELARDAQGPAPWRARMGVEARELFALDALDSRVTLVAIGVASELRACVRLCTPVACMEPDGALVVHDEVELALHYPPAILSRALAGVELVAIQRPLRVWHPNITWPAPDQLRRPQRVCLGANVPRGLPLREALVSTYAALSMQVITLDERDSAGYLNPQALSYWRDRQETLPLSREPFLGAAPSFDRGER